MKTLRESLQEDIDRVNAEHYAGDYGRAVLNDARLRRSLASRKTALMEQHLSLIEMGEFGIAGAYAYRLTPNI